MEREKIPALAKKRTKAIYNGGEYYLIGYQVIYKEKETISSVCLEDERHCLVWADYKKVEVKQWN